MNRERKHRDAATGQYTTAEDAAARPGETVAEAVPERHETPDVAELRRLAEAANGLPAGSEWLHGEVADGNETVAEWMDKCSAHPDELAAGRLWLVWSEGSGTKVIIQAIVGDTETAPLRAAFMANANPAAVLGLLNRLDSMREAEAGLDRVAVAMGCGDEVAGYGVYREDVDGMVECARDLREHVSDHDECPRPCPCHDDRLAYPVSCEPCKGSGCGPGTASGAYEPCDHCAGTGADCSKGWVHVAALEAAEARLAHMTEARDNARAEVERLAAMVEAVREACADLEHDCVAGYCDPHEVRPAIESIAAILDEEPQP